MRITLHVYRTHDHDLMALHQTGVLSIGKAAKKAIIAYYKGEPLRISTKTSKKPDISLMPLSVTFGFLICESDAEGITNWINSIRYGYRNCFFKNVLRHYLDDPATYLFREDEWQAVNPDDTISTNSIIIPASHKQVPNELMGSEWVEAVAKEGKKKYTNKKISDLKDLLKQPELPKEQPLPVAPLHDTVNQEEDNFDAYAAFLELRNGE